MPKSITPSVESILNAVIDAVITINESGIIQSVNPAVEKIFGYTSKELIGKNVSMLMPNPYAREHDKHIQNYLRTGQSEIIGFGREVVAKKKDGTVFPASLSLSEGRKKDNSLFFTGVIRDVSQMKRDHDELKRQSEFTATVLNTLESLVIVLDRQGYVVSFNRACERVTGYMFAELTGRPFWDIFLLPKEKKLVMEHFSLLTQNAAHPLTHFENYWLTKSGDKRLISWSNAVLPNAQGGVEYVIGTGIDITEYRQLEHMVIEIAKKEQQRLGQELHDGIAQHLTSTAIVAKVLEKKLMRLSPSAARELKRVVSMVNQAVMQTRKLAQGLYLLNIHSEGLVPSLKKLAQNMEKTLGIRCVVQTDSNIHLMDDRAATHLYRIAREAVGNAVKHAKAKNIRIWLKKKNAHQCELRIENDGKKFSKPLNPEGLGLYLIKARAAMLKCSCQIVPGARGGATVSCVFPVPS